MRVVCCSMPGPGHTHPMLAVARALAWRGHEVTLCSSWAHKDEAERAGCGFIPLPDEEGSPQHALRLYDDAARMARFLSPRFAALRPDAILAAGVAAGPRRA